MGRKHLRRHLMEGLERRQLLSAGDLDTTFGNAGIVSTDFNGGLDTSQAIAQQGDGKIVSVGSTSTDNNFGGDFAIARYNLNGSLDTTFGGTGKLTTDFGGRDQAEAVLIQGDGKIIAGGWSDRGNFNKDFALARYNADGTLDNSFGNSGRVMTDFGSNGDDDIYHLLLQSDGKIIAVGRADAPSTGLWMIRYNSDVSIDTTFGNNGKVTATNSSTSIGIAYCAALQSDGKIVVGGEGASGGLITVGLMRFNTSGSVDTSFGFLGAVNDAQGTTQAQGLAIGGGGVIYVAATILGNPNVTKLFAYTSTGAKFNSFGTSGAVTISTGGFIGFPIGVKVQQDGSIYVAATSGPGGASYGSWTLAHLLSNGAMDTTFGTNGTVTTIAGSQAEGLDVLLEPDGRIVVGGYAGWNMALARYNGSWLGISNHRDLILDGPLNEVLITTSSGLVQRYDLTTRTLLAPLTVGTSLNGGDVTPDG